MRLLVTRTEVRPAVAKPLAACAVDRGLVLVARP
jgi:hypothetical protein